MLIPSIASEEGWKKYFNVDILRAYGYCQRIVNLYNKILTDSSNPMIKKMVMGIIGRDTVGHWKDIQQIYTKFLGIKCIRCEEAVKRIAMGIPFEKVVNDVSLNAIPQWKLFEDLKTLFLILNNIVTKVVSANEIEHENIFVNTDIQVKRLSGNPLEVLRLIKGFYSTIISLLPLYNEYSYFIYITRSMPMELLHKYFHNLDLNYLSKYSIYYNKIEVCKDHENGIIIIHSDNSVAHYVNMFVEAVYRFIKRSLKLNLSKFFNLVDEDYRYVSTMIEEVKNIGKEVPANLSEKVLNIIRRNSITQKIGTNYACSDTKILFYRDSCRVDIGSVNIDYSDFVEGLTPYFLTGLVIVKDLQKKNSGIVKARLRVYYPI